MHSYLPWMHEFCTLDIHCRFVNISLKHLKRSSQFIIHLSSFPFEHWSKATSCWCQEQQSFKVALSDSTNVSIGSISSSIGGSSSIRIISIAFQMAPSLTLYSRPNAHLLNAFSLLKFAMISHHWTLVKWVASSFTHFPLHFIELEGLENVLCKVRTYQLSAHQRLWFKVRT